MANCCMLVQQSILFLYHLVGVKQSNRAFIRYFIHEKTTNHITHFSFRLEHCNVCTVQKSSK